MGDLELFLNITNYFTQSISDLKQQLADALASGKTDNDKLQQLQSQLADDEQKNADLEAQLAKYQNPNSGTDPKTSLTEALQTVSQHFVSS